MTNNFRPLMRWLSLNMILLPLSVLLVTVSHALDWSGYYEGQVTGFDVRGSAVWQQTNRLRLDWSADLGRQASVSGDVIWMTYQGETVLNLLDILPEKISEEIMSMIGSSVDQLVTLDYDTSEVWLDNAYVSLYPGAFLIRVGRQQLPWGTGYTWNPTDIFNSKSIVDPTYEKIGKDALKLEWGFGEAGAITAVWVLADKWSDSSQAVKVKDSVAGVTMSLSYMRDVLEEINISQPGATKQTQRQVVGADMVGQLVGAGWWSEAAWVHTNDEQNDYWQLLLGWNNTFDWQTMVMMEYYHDHRGEKNPDDYQLNDWFELGLGSRTTLGRDYLMMMVNHPLSALLDGMLMAIINLNDQSVVWIPSIDYNYADNLILSLTGNIFTGSTNSEYGGLKGSGGYIRVKAFY